MVMMRLVEGPPLTAVRSSPSPKPSWAGPLVQELSSNSRRCQFVPWLEPLSRYFQTAPVETSVSAAQTGDRTSARATGSRHRQKGANGRPLERALRLRIDWPSIRFGDAPLRQGTAAGGAWMSVTVP